MICCKGDDDVARALARGNRAPSPPEAARRRLIGASSLAFLVLLAIACWIAPGSAQDSPPAKPQINIAYVEIEDDPRYAPVRAYERIILKSRAHPFAGAELGLDDAAPLARALKADFRLQRITVKAAADVAPAVRTALDAGTHFFLIDAPAESFRPLADAVRGREALLLNVSEPEDSLRRAVCAAEFVHTYPSRAQLTDGLVQFLVSRKWRDLLVLEGPSPADVAMTAAFTRSAQKFGARIVADQHFKPGTDPREREANDPILLTAISRDYDAVFVADEAFDFARTVPYRVSRPRPIVGSIDLEPVAWHWTWERHGAPQVNSRFERKSGGRHMDGPDWAAWMAVKMIVQSSLRTDTADFGRQRAYILGDNSFDGAKGLAVSVRPWDHQLRQAVLLAAPYEIVADAPVEAFLHRTNTLDTLGDDEPETPCRLGK
jgi:ABC transporter substrate binding protein (PQQ-dependent alcohol dehydrogenase system)